MPFYSELNTAMSLRAAARKIYRAALDAVDPEAAVRRCVRRDGDSVRVGRRRYAGRRYRRVHVLGAGKAAAAMARGLERALGPRLQGGLVVVKYGHSEPLRRVRVLEAGHPEPDANGLAGARALMEYAAGMGPEDLVFFLLSGGASALLPLPAPGISPADKVALSALLLRCGASIQEMNTVRKHVSQIKGGQLARRLGAAAVVSLILSDVVGDDLSSIGSGPTVPDPTTYADSLAVLRRYGLTGQVSEAVRRHLEAGAGGAVPETPKPGDPCFAGKHPLIIGSNVLACRAAAAEARRQGYKPLILSSSVVGDTRAAAALHVAIAGDALTYGHPRRPPACLISGGETTIRVTGDGRGGRNQEFVLSAVPALGRLPAPVLLVSLGTDGTDGPTDAAGAWADNRTAARAAVLGLPPVEEFLDRNDSYHFFQPLGDLIKTGPTRTNVMDLRFFLLGEPGMKIKRQKAKGKNQK